MILILVFVGWFVLEQNTIKTELISVKGAPDAFSGYRIVVISDLHAKQFGAGNEKLLEKVAELRPDMIALIGDLLDETSEFADIPSLAAGLSAITDTYYVTGNHEWAMVGHVPELKELLRDNGVTVLTNEHRILERNGAQILLVGVDDPNGPADQKSIKEVVANARADAKKGTYVLLLAHRNNLYEQYAESRVDLTLSGHAHGGLVRLPFTDGLIGPRREWLPEYTAGLYQLEVGQMVVSRGLGGKPPAFRLFNRPDLPLVILQT
ncbi:MAG: metallophosphoesterase [Evtepia sp.]